MDEPAFLLSSRVAIVGLGLMGGSLAMALRGRCAALLGVDSDPQTLALARQLALVEHAADSPADILPEADLVVLAIPVRAILTLLARLPDLHPGAAVVMDLGSTKQQVVAAMQGLPGRFDPVGGHPMCGKETSSLASAEAGLYRGASFALTSLPRTSARARKLAEELARTVGSAPLWIDAETHDRWVAATSHLPYLLASALAAATPAETAPLAGPGLRSTARLAASSVPMMLDILATNRANVLESLVRFRQALIYLESYLETSDLEGLRQQLSAGAASYEALVGPHQGRGDPAPTPDGSTGA